MLREYLEIGGEMSKLPIDDQFSTWHDHEAPEIHDMSRYDMAACAWHEAWKRATEAAGKTFSEWNKLDYKIIKGSKGKVVFTDEQVIKKNIKVVDLYGDLDPDYPDDFNNWDH